MPHGSAGTASLILPRLTFWPVLLVPFLSRAAAPAGANNVPTLLPPHAEIPPTFWEQYGVWIIVLAFFIALLAGIYAWLVTRPQPALVIPPEDEARLALAGLGVGATDGATLSRVSQILRRYVRRAFNLPANEQTTTEFSRLLEGSRDIGPELALLLGGFFRANDFQKFAPSAPIQSEKFNPVAEALMMIDKCEARRASLRTAPAAAATTPAVKPA